MPFLRQKPSEYVRQNIWVTTQPIEEPERPRDMLSTLEWIGIDRIMFSTDYPHWDQDDPRYRVQGRAARGMEAQDLSRQRARAVRLD